MIVLHSKLWIRKILTNGQPLIQGKIGNYIYAFMRYSRFDWIPYLWDSNQTKGMFWLGFSFSVTKVRTDAKELIVKSKHHCLCGHQMQEQTVTHDDGSIHTCRWCEKCNKYYTFH